MYLKEPVETFSKVVKRFGLMFLVALSGCKEELPPGPPKLVPTSGRVTHDGQPLAGVVVQFLPSGPGGNLSIGETDAEGKYTLSHNGFPGCTPGEYKVGFSLRISQAGKPVTIGQQSSLAPNEAFIGSKEVIPKKYSSLGETTVTATVPESGGSFDFDLKGPFEEPPKPADASKAEAAPKAEENSKTSNAGAEKAEAKAKMP